MVKRSLVALGALVVASTIVVSADASDARDAGAHVVSVVTHTTRMARTQPVEPQADVDAIKVAAVQRNRFLGVVPAGSVTVSQVRTSGDHASALLTPQGGQTDPAQVVLKRDAQGWTVQALGTDGVGCDLPRATRSALALWGDCPA